MSVIGHIEVGCGRRAFRDATGRVKRALVAGAIDGRFVVSVHADRTAQVGTLCIKDEDILPFGPQAPSREARLIRLCRGRVFQCSGALAQCLQLSGCSLKDFYFSTQPGYRECFSLLQFG